MTRLTAPHYDSLKKLLKVPARRGRTVLPVIATVDPDDSIHLDLSF
jgi:hypothetical protein